VFELFGQGFVSKSSAREIEERLRDLERGRLASNNRRPNSIVILLDCNWVQNYYITHTNRNVGHTATSCCARFDVQSARPSNLTVQDC
jgi:hypothetical protein